MSKFFVYSEDYFMNYGGKIIRKKRLSQTTQMEKGILSRIMSVYECEIYLF